MTLSSHPGKALVFKDKFDKFNGHVVHYFCLGDASKALDVTIWYVTD
jgi:hypothetical protein